jgi:hypothetical protein
MRAVESVHSVESKIEAQKDGSHLKYFEREKRGREEGRGGAIGR